MSLTTMPKFNVGTIRSTIIVPTYNRASELEKTLIGLANQTLDTGEFEIVVVDNGSTDQTRDTVWAANRRFGDVVRYVFEPVPGLLAARHRGALEANGELLTYVDDDIDPEVGWLAAISASFDDPSVHLVGGPCVAKYEADPPDWLEAFQVTEGTTKLCGHLSLIDCGATAREIHPGRVWGLNYSIRKSTLQEAGGFHPDKVPKSLQRYQGDGETGLSAKLHALSYKAWYEPRAKVVHRTPKERLNLAFFQARSYYQGISDSYRDLRATPSIAREEPENRTSILQRLRHSVAYRVRSVFRAQKSSPSVRFRKEIELVTEAYYAGFDFHQREALGDADLLRWIQRENYWDYQLTGTVSTTNCNEQCY